MQVIAVLYPRDRVWEPLTRKAIFSRGIMIKFELQPRMSSRNSLDQAEQP